MFCSCRETHTLARAHARAHTHARTHTHVHARHLKYTTQSISGSQTHRHTLVAQTLPSCRTEESPEPSLPHASSLPPSPHPTTHTFRSTSLVPLEQVMTTQGGSAAMATPSPHPPAQPRPPVLWWGPDKEQLLAIRHPQGSTTEQLEGPVVASSLSSSH